MSDPAARVAVCVTLLGDDPAARRMLISWPLLPTALTDRARLREWARLSGVAVSVAARTAVVLERHGLVLPGGQIDPEAAKVLAHIAATELRSTRRTTR
jgi:hypothetical protein